MNESIGEKLRRAREARQLSLEKVSRDTLMRVRYLEALESGSFDRLPSMVQARGFLRTYAGYLDLDAEALIREMNGEDERLLQPAAGPSYPVPAPPAEKPEPVSEEANEIFREVGSRLQQRREMLGLSLDDVARHTHLRQRYLEAIESGELADLPSPVQGRGMLHNYAAFLGMDPDPLLLRFADGLQTRLAARQSARKHQEEGRAAAQAAPRPRRKPSRLPPPLRRLFSSDLLIGGVFIAFLAAFLIWGAVRIFALGAADAESVSPTAPSIADVLLATETPTPSPTALSASPTIPPPSVAAAEELPEEETAEADATPEGAAGSEASGEGVTIYITVHQRAWMRVLVDGDVEFEGRVLPGSAYSYSGEEQVEVITGNGAALQVFFNQEDMGMLGFFGEVVDRVFTAEGISTPTPTITPTGTATPRPSATPPVTPTPQGTLPALP